MTEVLINDKWPLLLPDWRAEFYAKHTSGWEAVRLDEMFKLVSPGMLIYDVGAEQGDFTSLYKLWTGETGDVIPIEPSPPYWPIIKEIWEMNHAGKPRNCFVGFASDDDYLSPQLIDFNQGEQFESWPVSAYREGIPEFGFRHLAQQTDSTPQITIDSLSKITGDPDIVVIDVEGAEWNVLHGSLELMKRNKPSFFVSIHPQTMKDWYNKTPEDIHALMEENGYKKEYLGHEIEEFWVYTPVNN